MDKASVGQQAAGIERHPEVCFLTITALGDNADRTVYSEGSRYISSDLREITTHHTLYVHRERLRRTKRGSYRNSKSMCVSAVHWLHLLTDNVFEASRFAAPAVSGE